MISNNYDCMVKNTIRNTLKTDVALAQTTIQTLISGVYKTL